MKHESFHDPRLSPQENKAVEMLRNGFSRGEIAEEMDIDLKHLSVLFYGARQRGVDVPRCGRNGGRKPKVPIEELVQLDAKLRAHGMVGYSLMEAMRERTGLTANCIKVRLWRYKNGIRPKRARAA